jgi:hypothetical protein
MKDFITTSKKTLKVIFVILFFLLLGYYALEGPEGFVVTGYEMVSK